VQVRACERTQLPRSGSSPNRVRAVAEEWTMIVTPLPLDAWRAAFAELRAANDPESVVDDDDLRVDVMRTTGGDRVRVMARSALVANVVGRTDP
jgi:hypothetical protein